MVADDPGEFGQARGIGQRVVTVDEYAAEKPTCEDQSQKCQREDDFHAVRGKPFATALQALLEPLLAALPVRAERWAGGKDEQGDAGQEQKRLQRPGFVANLDLMASRGQREGSEVGKNADE